jgi:hypothetical protein
MRYFNVRTNDAAHGGADVTQMNALAQMQGFPSAAEMMMAYQQNMMTMMKSMLEPVVSAVSSRGRGGRGLRGRGGGRGVAQYEAATGESGTSTTAVGADTSAAENDAAATSYYRGGGGRVSRGRSTFRGRGRAPVAAAGNKVWVREPTVDSSLPSK